MNTKQWRVSQRAHSFCLEIMAETDSMLTVFSLNIDEMKLELNSTFEV